MKDVEKDGNYYPFGLTMAGISSKALKGNYAENRYKFSGKELANKEFSDGSGLELYEMGFRTHDPQIGRFLQIDPLANKYVYNSCYSYAENKVTMGIDLEGLELLPFNSAWFRAAVDYKTFPQYGDMKFSKERVYVVASNVPDVFKDASGAPLFSASSVNIGPNGGILNGNEVGPQFVEGNNLPASPGWTWGDGPKNPSRTASTGGWKMGTNSLGDNKAFADQAGAVAAAPNEGSKWFKLFSHDKPIWEAYGKLYDNQNSFSKSVDLVGQTPMGMATTPRVRADLVNFVNDGTIPTLNVDDLKGSLQYGSGIMQTGIQIMNRNGIQVQRSVMETYNLYNNLLQFLNNSQNKK